MVVDEALTFYQDGVLRSKQNCKGHVALLRGLYTANTCNKMDKKHSGRLLIKAVEYFKRIRRNGLVVQN